MLDATVTLTNFSEHFFLNSFSCYPTIQPSLPERKQIQKLRHFPVSKSCQFINADFFHVNHCCLGLSPYPLSLGPLLLLLNGLFASYLTASHVSSELSQHELPVAWSFHVCSSFLSFTGRFKLPSVTDMSPKLVSIVCPVDLSSTHRLPNTVTIHTACILYSRSFFFLKYPPYILLIISLFPPGFSLMDCLVQEVFPDPMPELGVPFPALGTCCLSNLSITKPATAFHGDLHLSIK